MPKPAVFLDRDGTLIEDVGVLSDPADIHLFPDTVETLRALQRHYLLFVITNQNGVAKGLITQQQADAVNQALDQRLKHQGITIRKWYVCPHHRDEGCVCIKPNPTFLRQAAAEFEVDLCKSYVIGDHPHDPATAEGVGATGMYVLTGHGRRHRDQLPDGVRVFETLGEAGTWILQKKVNLNPEIFLFSQKQKKTKKK